MKKLFLVASALIFLAACRTQQDERVLAGKIPSSYQAPGDTGSHTPPAWRGLVFDSTLVRLIDSALKYNFDLRTAEQQVELAMAGMKLTRGIRLPEVQASMQGGVRRFGYYTMDGVGNYDTKFSPNLTPEQQIPDPLPDYYIGLQSSWEIDLWGRLKNMKKAAAARFIASQHGRNLLVTQLVWEVTAAYLELIAIGNELKILEESIALQEDALEIVSAQMQTGKANQLGVDMINAQLLNSKAIYAQTRQQKIEYANRLALLCGSFSKPLVHDSMFSNRYVRDSLLAGIPSDLLRNRPDILQAEMEMRAARADVSSARAAFYPSLNINASIGYQAFNAALLIETPASVAYSLFGGLTAPLLNRRKIKAALMTAEAGKKLAYIRYEKTVVNSFMEVYNALTNIEASREMLALKQREAGLFRQSVFTSNELFKAGRAGFLEVIVAQRNALQSQIELVNYRKKQQLAVINLYRALGGGWQ